jgi:hypothetical protein
MNNAQAVLLIGGPDAGKTNFLIRLWLAIRKKTGRLRAEGIPADLEYLETGVDKLLRGEFAPHTPREVHNRIVIPVKESNAGESHATLIIPDCSGEEWLAIYRKREWSQEWEDVVSDTCGCLLFVRVDSDQNITPLDWITCTKVFGSPMNLPDSPENGGGEHETPTQVIMTDWLQCLRRAFTERVGGFFRPRIGIIVAAWDRIPMEQQHLGPEKYLDTNFPMFKQFIDTNEDYFNFAIFGVSIVGGDLRNAPGFREEYLKGDPHKTGYVVHCLKGVVEKANDLTIPVVWAMGLNISIT